MIMRPTPSQVRALIAVRDGKVINRFDPNKNVFEVPKGINAAIVRKLQHKRWIEDVPGRPSGSRHYPQQLTQVGEIVLAMAEADPNCFP